MELHARVRYHSSACINQRRRTETPTAFRASQRALAERVSELASSTGVVGEGTTFVIDVPLLA